MKRELGSCDEEEGTMGPDVDKVWIIRKTSGLDVKLSSRFLKDRGKKICVERETR